LKFNRHLGRNRDFGEDEQYDDESSLSREDEARLGGAASAFFKGGAKLFKKAAKKTGKVGKKGWKQVRKVGSKAGRTKIRASAKKHLGTKEGLKNIWKKFEKYGGKAMEKVETLDKICPSVMVILKTVDEHSEKNIEWAESWEKPCLMARTAVQVADVTRKGGNGGVKSDNGGADYYDEYMQSAEYSLF